MSKFTTKLFFFKYMNYFFLHLTKVGLPIFEWAVPRPFVHLRVEIMVLLSMNSDRIFERLIFNSYTCTNTLRCSFVSKFTTKLFFFKYVNYFFLHLTKVGLPIFEWAVPRPFVHLRVEIMVLLSMNSDRIFERMILNSSTCMNSLRCSFVSKFTTKLFFFKYMDYFFVHLTKVGPPIFEWAVPRPFVHLRVEIMVLPSMNSDRIFERMILNSYA